MLSTAPCQTRKFLSTPSPSLRKISGGGVTMGCALTDCKVAKRLRSWGGRRESNPHVNVNSITYRASDGTENHEKQCKTTNRIANGLHTRSKEHTSKTPIYSPFSWNLSALAIYQQLSTRRIFVYSRQREKEKMTPTTFACDRPWKEMPK